MDLTGLAVKLTDDKGISKVVELSEFKNYAITITPNVETALKTTDNKVVLKIGKLTFDFSITVSNKKETEKSKEVKNPEKTKKSNTDTNTVKDKMKKAILKTAISNNIFIYGLLSLMSLITVKVLNKKKDEM